MNLTDVERLSRRIGELLDGRVPLEQARPIAQEYAALTESAAHRLRQCVGMLEQGDETQALQLADASPPLLDLVTRLGFRRLAEWREYCLKNGLPCAENLDATFIRQLNEAYARGIPPGHQLYRQLREAMLGRDDTRILDALRAVLRRNESDTNARTQLERLERKVLDQQLARLGDALHAGDNARVMALLEEVESLGFSTRPSGPVWSQAQSVRCSILLQQACRHRDRQPPPPRAALLPLVQTPTSLVQALIQEESLVLPAADARTLADLEAWLGEHRRHAAEDRDFERSLDELRHRVETCEQQLQDTALLPRPELRERIQSLEGLWRKLEGFRREVDPQLDRRRARILEVLRDQLESRDRRMRRFALAGLSLVVILALLLGRMFWNQHRAREFVAELTSLRESRHVTASRKTVEEAQRHLTRLSGSSPALRLALDESARFLDAEAARLQSCQAQLSQLGDLVAKGFDTLTPEQTQARFESSRKAVSELAIDLQPPQAATLAELRLRWEEWLGVQRKARLADFDRRVAELETASGKLRYDRGPDGVASVLRELEPAQRELAPLAAPPVPQWTLPPDALARHTALTRRIASFAEQVTRWQSITNAWNNPGSLPTYLSALRELQRSEFASAAEQARAGAVIALDLTDASLAAGLLLPGDAEGWRRFEQRPALSGMPSQVLPGERARFNALRDDENLFNIFRCQLTRVATPTEEARTWTVFSRGPLGRNKFGRQIGRIYDPSVSTGPVEFPAREFNSAEFTVALLGPAGESDLADRIGLKRLIEGGTGTNFSASAMGILDALNREDVGSPLCRAYLTLRLHELIELRPHDWDAHWAPQATADRRQLLALGAQAIASGDWLDLQRSADLDRRLTEYFRQARQVSYLQQAAFLNRLARAAHDTGFQLVGNADAAGAAHLPLPLPAGTELWGWAEGTRTPALLFRIRQGSTATGTQPGLRALPMTPLYRFRGDRAQILEETRRSTVQGGSLATLGARLPPLFSPAHE
jgi:hypothetical protein